MWAAVAIVIPFWLILWQAEPILIAFGQDPELSADAARFVRAVMWGLLPYFFFLILRSFISALEKPLWALVVGGVAVLFIAALHYCLLFGALGFPALGLLGAGIGRSLSHQIGSASCRARVFQYVYNAGVP